MGREEGSADPPAGCLAGRSMAGMLGGLRSPVLGGGIRVTGTLSSSGRAFEGCEVEKRDTATLDLMWGAALQCTKQRPKMVEDWSEGSSEGVQDRCSDVGVFHRSGANAGCRGS